jgi:hypothetical protein
MYQNNFMSLQELHNYLVAPTINYILLFSIIFNDKSSSDCCAIINSAWSCQLVTGFLMMPTEIPVDVLLNILEYVDKADLATICRLNKICCSCSQDFLYRDICVKTRKAPGLEQTLAKSTHLARRVRSFESRYNADLATALRNMTSLRILKLWSAFDMDFLDGCTFKLDSFEWSCVDNYEEPLKKFFSSQPSLKYVAFPMNFVTTLEATCLPNLTRICAMFAWLPHLIPGRPLNEVISDGYTNEHSIDLSFFALSTTPIQKLTIDYSYLCSTPAHLLASFLPSLTHFTLTVGKSLTSFEHEGVCGIPLY